MFGDLHITDCDDYMDVIVKADCKLVRIRELIDAYSHPEVLTELSELYAGNCNRWHEDNVTVFQNPCVGKSQLVMSVPVLTDVDFEVENAAGTLVCFLRAREKENALFKLPNQTLLSAINANERYEYGKNGHYYAIVKRSAIESYLLIN